MEISKRIVPVCAGKSSKLSYSFHFSTKNLNESPTVQCTIVSCLSRNHFIEYLCFLIRESGIDTLEILSTSDLETVVRRANRRLPVRPYVYRQDITIANSIFHRELIKVLIEQNLLIVSICFFLISYIHSPKSRLMMLFELNTMKKITFR